MHSKKTNCFLVVCFLQVVAFRVKFINNDTALLPNHAIKLISFDDGSDVNIAFKAALELVQVHNVSGIIGPASSALSQVVATIANAFQTPQISYSSTSPVLSDKATYPYFFRTCPSDALQGQVWMSIIKHFGWEAIGLISTNDAYGSGAGTVVSNAATALNVTVKIWSQFTPGSTAENLVQNLKAIKQSRAKIIVVAAVYQDARAVLQAAYEEGMLGPESGYTYILAEAAAVEEQFLTQDSYTEIFKKYLVGTIGTRPVRGNGPLWDRLSDDWMTRDPNNYTGAGSPITDGYAAYVFDTVYAFAHAADSLIRQGFEPRGDMLHSTIKNLRFTGVTSDVYFDANQDRASAFEILNVQPLDYGTPSTTYWRVIGTWTPNDTATLQFYDEESIYWPQGPGSKNLPTDGVARSLVYITWSSGFAIAIIVLVAVLLILQVLTAIAIIYYRTTPVIVYSSMPFLLTMQVGFVLTYASALAWLGDPTIVSCNIRIWFGFTGFTLSYAALIAKVFRVYRIFSLTHKIKRIVLTNAQLFRYVLGIVTVILIVLILWVSLDPFSPYQTLNNAETDILWTCSSENIAWSIIAFAYCGILGMAAIFLSFATRKLPSSFRETYWINNASFIVFFVGVVCVVLGFLLADNLEASYAVALIGILLVPTAIWGFLFIPKLYICIIVPEKNVKASTFSKSTPNNNQSSIQMSSVEEHSSRHQSSV